MGIQTDRLMQLAARDRRPSRPCKPDHHIWEKAVGGFVFCNRCPVTDYIGSDPGNFSNRTGLYRAADELAADYTARLERFAAALREEVAKPTESTSSQQEER